MPNNPNNPWGNGNWWDYGAGYPNPFDPDGSLRYFYYNYEYDPYGLPFVPWFLGGGGVTNQLSIARQFIINNLDLNSSERNYIQNIASENKINILAEIFAEDDNFIENKIIAEAFAEFLTNENQSNLNLGAPKLLELQQYTQDVISEGVVSVAKYLRKVYLAAKKYCDQNPSHLVLYNSFIIEPIRTGANNVTNKNSETFSWGDLFSIWIFELGNYPYRSLPKYALSGNVPTISILQDADVITGNNINDPSINAFKNLSSVKNLRTDVKNNLKLGTLNVNGIIEEPFTFDTNEYYGSLATQNIAKIFLGSFQTKAVIISKNSNSAVVKFYVENLSGWESATRFIKAEGGNSSIIDNKPRGSGINLGGNLGQIYEWTESITW